MAQERYGMSAEMVDVLSMKYYCYRSNYKNVEFKSLDEFLLWSRGKYDYGMVLQRKDKDGPISPQNCRWVKVIKSEAAQGKKHKAADSPRYKALGNSIAIPPWKWVLKRLCARYERDATMASLFDGIGGFPLIWEQINGKGSCLWASEIEEFPMAVTKVRFGE